jgi:hypothetical protein
MNLRELGTGAGAATDRYIVNTQWWIFCNANRWSWQCTARWWWKYRDSERAHCHSVRIFCFRFSTQLTTSTYVQISLLDSSPPSGAHSSSTNMDSTVLAWLAWLNPSWERNDYIALCEPGFISFVGGSVFPIPLSRWPTRFDVQRRTLWSLPWCLPPWWIFHTIPFVWQPCSVFSCRYREHRYQEGRELWMCRTGGVGCRTLISVISWVDVQDMMWSIPFSSAFQGKWHDFLLVGLFLSLIEDEACTLSTAQRNLHRLHMPNLIHLLTLLLDVILHGT